MWILFLLFTCNEKSDCNGDSRLYGVAKFPTQQSCNVRRDWYIEFNKDNEHVKVTGFCVKEKKQKSGR